EVHANRTNGSGAGEVGVGDVAAFDEIDVVELGHLRSPSAEICVFERIYAAAGFDTPPAANRGTDFLARFALFLDRFVVVPVQSLALLKFEKVVHIGDDGGLVSDAENVRAQIEDLCGDVLIGAVDE